MKRMNNKGNTSYEILTVSVTCLILAAVLLVAILRNVSNQKFQMFQYNSKVFALNAVTLTNFDTNRTVYLYEMIDQNLIEPIKNPFSGEDHYCDIYESKVQILTDDKKVTLKCGEFLIDNQSVHANEFQIYRVSDWKDEATTDHDEIRNVYNIEIWDEIYFDTYYEKDLFLIKVNNLLNSNYSSIEEVMENYDILSKQEYRTKSKIKTMSSIK